ncbi:hypothetical protein ScPMuIL_013725 [Solemya velum]
MSQDDRESLPPYGTLIRVPEPEPPERIYSVKNKLKKPTMKAMMETADKEDVNEENGVLFWVNKSGFPVDDYTWERMYDHVSRIHPDNKTMVHKIRSCKDLPQMPVPQVPSFPPMMLVCERLEKIQNYMNTLQYNHTGTQFFEIRKNRPISGLMEIAKDMIRDSLPIKCLEAIILGIYLTNGFLGVERFVISFKSVFNGNVHRHVVLGVYYGGKYGALGLSRRDDLMYKPLYYKSLSDLVMDYLYSYRKYWHEVKKLKIGLPIPHDPHSYELICWKALILNVNKMTSKEIMKETEQHSREIRTKAKSWLCSSPPSPKKVGSSADILKGSSLASSVQHAERIYRSNTVHVGSKKKDPKKEDLSQYQIRI